MLLILAGVSINLVLGNNGIIAKSKDAREQTQRAEAKDDVDLAVANMQIEAAQRTMTQEEKRQSIENELKKIRSESTVTINGDGFKANHKGYEFEISDTGKTSVNKPDEPFEASKWDRTAAPEDVFIWASDDPSSPDYGKVVGYKSNVDNYPVLRYPSRCTSVGVDNSYITGTDEEKEIIRSYTKNIKKVELPETVTEMGEIAFGEGNWRNGYRFESLEEINIPNEVRAIKEMAFSGCKKLKSIEIPDKVTIIGDNAFYGCKSLSSIIIPDGVTSIGKSAFWGCENLENVSIQNSVISVGGSAFGNTAWYNNQPNGLIYVGKVAYDYKGTMPQNTQLEIRDGTTCISGNAFSNYTNLSSITIPDSVTSIGSDTFSWCTNLSSVTMSNNVTSIGDRAFSYCSSLNSITIPESVISMGYRAFANCTTLSSVTISDGVTIIGDSAFSDCTGLSNVKIPDSVTSIGWSAFENVQHIEYHGTATGSPWGANSIN